MLRDPAVPRPSRLRPRRPGARAQCGGRGRPPGMPGEAHRPRREKRRLPRPPSSCGPPAWREGSTSDPWRGHLEPSGASEDRADWPRWPSLSPAPPSPLVKRASPGRGVTNPWAAGQWGDRSHIECPHSGMWGDSHVLHPVRPGEGSPTALGGTIPTSAQAPADNSDLNKRHGTCSPNSVQSESLLPEHEVTRRLRCPRLV